MVKPCALSMPTVSRICWIMTGASPSVGSSNSNSRAPVRKMRAIASICCSPPDNLVPWLLSRSRKLGNSAKMRSTSSPPGRTCGGRNRFSRTSRLEKIPRSSGQKAMPARAIASEGSPVNSRPSKSTEPLRCSAIPMIALSVVVLPTPFLPNSVTTSPARTSKVTPCRICDSPYQAWRSFTASIGGGAGFFSSMAGPKIGFAHRRILRHRRIVAFGQYLAAREHGDTVAQIGHDAEIMFHQQDSAGGGDGFDQRADAADILMSHAGGRLIQQQELRIESQGGRDFKRALVPIGQLDRQHVRIRGQADIGDQRQGTFVKYVQCIFRPPKIE